MVSRRRHEAVALKGCREKRLGVFVYWPAALCLALMTLLPLATARAGAMRPCTKPTVFQDAALNAFVLPYRYVGDVPNRGLDQAGRRIAALVHLEILFSMLKYGSVGGTNLIAEPGNICDVDTVITTVTQGTGPGTLVSGRSLVVVWGRLFEEHDQLYVQSYLRFLRRGHEAREAIKVSLPSHGGPLDLTGPLPTHAIAFPPRRIAKSDLEAIEREFRASMVVRKQKRLDEPGQSIDFGPNRPFPYGITRTEGEWMWIEPMAGGPKGWVRVRTGEESAWSLRSWMPELAYIDAVTGFMRLRASTPAVTEPARLTRLSAWIEQAFVRFETAVSADEADTAYGLARAMRGFMLWDRRGEAAARSTAARLFAEAKTLLSEYAAARNLAAVTRPFIADRPRLDKDVIEKMGMDLLAAIALDPRNAPALANLEALYAFAHRQPDVSPFSAQDLTHRIAIVRTARTQAGSQ